MTSGNFTLRAFKVDPVTLAVLIDQNATIPWNANASTFCSKLNQFTWFGSYSTTCTLTMQNASGITTNAS